MRSALIFFFVFVGQGVFGFDAGTDTTGTGGQGGGAAAITSGTQKTAAPVQEAPVVIDSETIENIARQAVLDACAAQPGLEARVEIVSATKPLTLKGSGYELRAETPPAPLQSGYQSVRVRALHGERWLGASDVSLRVRLFAKVPVAARALNMHETADAAAVTFETRELAPSLEPLPSSTHWNTLRARQGVRAGQILEARFFEPAPVILKGERVTVRIVRGGLLVTALGEAAQEAAPGQPVRIKMLDSNSELTARACAPGLAEL